MLKSKKRLIIVLVIVGVFALLLILGSALFSLKGVTVEYILAGDNLNLYSKEQVIKTGSFPYGKNILFLKYDSNIEKIEAGFPYAKVTDVTRYFPNKIVVRITERQPAFRFLLNNGNWAVVDDDLKVLKIAEESELSSREAAVPVWNEFSVNQASISQFLNLDYEKVITKNIVNAIGQDSVGLSTDVMQSIEITKNVGQPDVITIVMDDGPTIRIFGAENLLVKAVKGFERYNAVAVGDPSRVITVLQNGEVSG